MNLSRTLAPLSLLAAMLLAPTAMAQALRFTTAAGHRGDTVTVEVWFDPGSDVDAYQLEAPYDSGALQLAAVEPETATCVGNHDTNTLHVLHFSPTGTPFAAHLACTVSFRIADTAPHGWHSMVDYPHWDMAAGGEPVPSHLDEGGVFVIDADPVGTCQLHDEDIPDPEFVPEFAPLCRCLKTEGLPMHRCRFYLAEELVLVREFPPVDPREWDTETWTVIPLAEQLSQIQIFTGSMSGTLYSKPITLEQGLKPLQALTIDSPFQAKDSEALRHMRTTLKLGEHVYEFDHHWPVEGKH